jgi:hypothetical protein
MSKPNIKEYLEILTINEMIDIIEELADCIDEDGNFRGYIEDGEEDICNLGMRAKIILNKINI